MSTDTLDKMQSTMPLTEVELRKESGAYVRPIRPQYSKKTIQIMGYQVCISSIKGLLGVRGIINTINPHSYCEAKHDVLFKNALLSSDLLAPDGTGIVLAAGILKGVRIKRIAGADIHFQLLKEANKEHLNVFYLGASEFTLHKITERINNEFPNLNVSTYSPPFKSDFTGDDNRLMIEAINDFNPDILFVGMTAPKQEKWVYQNKESLNAPLICSIGAVFDFFVDTKKRAGPVWQFLGLEWLPRFVRDPRRMWRRVFTSIPVFLVDVFKFRTGLLK